MRRLALACAAFACGCAHPWAIPPRPGEHIRGPARAIDGDTLEMQLRGHAVRVRLLGLDTPERGQPGWAQARDDLARKLSHGPISCTIGPRPRDAFGRILAQCIFEK
jgi:endonuclease YncB( thermonuclease family)